MGSTHWRVYVRLTRIHSESTETNIVACTGRIPPNTTHQARIYPLPHTYVVKDLVPDLTQFYKQYKSIKPYLQRSTKTEDVRPPHPFSPVLTLNPVQNQQLIPPLPHRASKTANHPQTAKSLTGSTNASSAPAAPPPAPRTGGTAKNTSAPPSSSNPTAGSPTRATSTRPSARRCSTTA